MSSTARTVADFARFVVALLPTLRKVFVAHGGDASRARAVILSRLEAMQANQAKRDAEISERFDP